MKTKAQEMLDFLNFNEMSTIGRSEDPKIGELHFSVHKEPQGNFSIHIIFKKEYEVVLQLKDLKILEWKWNIKKIKWVPKKHLKEMVKFLKAPDKQFPEQTNWKVLLMAWNRENPKYEQDVNMKMPDWKKKI